MPSTVPEIAPLVNNFTLLLLTHQSIFKQGRIFRRVIVLAFAEVLAFNRHTVTLLLCWAWSLATEAVGIGCSKDTSICWVSVPAFSAQR